MRFCWLVVGLKNIAKLILSLRWKSWVKTDSICNVFVQLIFTTLPDWLHVNRIYSPWQEEHIGPRTVSRPCTTYFVDVSCEFLVFPSPSTQRAPRLNSCTLTLWADLNLELSICRFFWNKTENLSKSVLYQTIFSCFDFRCLHFNYNVVVPADSSNHNWPWKPVKKKLLKCFASNVV